MVRLRATIANLQQHVTSRDLLISELRDRATRDAADRALLRSELREAERAALREAATQAPAPPAGARTFTLREPRTKLSGAAPVEPFVMDMMRSLMDEANISFAAVPKCIALVWAMLCVDPIPPEFLFSRPTMTAAYLRLHEMDNKAAAQRRREADAPWAFAADGGNKGTPVNLVAVSYWDSERCEPLAEPLTVAPLDGDQTARNCADTVNAAIAGSGLSPGRCVQAMSDGCETAKNEAELVLAEQHRRHKVVQAARAAGGAAEEGREQQQQ